jgi:PPP family 3-phenylpropionic acid transporter
MTTALVVAAQYFTYFGVLGIYLPFFNLYCYHLGFNGAQIGLISGIRYVALVVFPLIWGAVADRYRKRRAIYLTCTIASTLVWTLLLFTRDFPVMLAVIAAYGVFYAPIISFLEAIALDTLGDSKGRYGRLRAWGSVSFIIVVLLMGQLTERFSVSLVVPLILAGSMTQGALAFFIRSDMAGPRSTQFRDAFGFLSRPTVLFLLAGFLMLFSHGTYYGFFSIHLEELGLGKPFIGSAWAVAVLAEIVVMVNSQRIFSRFSLESVLITAFVTAAVRWAVLGVTGHPAVILASQTLHAVSYAAFHMASILYIDRQASGSVKTMGQAINNSLSYGLGLMAGFLVNGALYDRWGAEGLFQMSAASAVLGGGLVWLLTRTKPRSSR